MDGFQKFFNVPIPFQLLFRLHHILLFFLQQPLVLPFPEREKSPSRIDKLFHLIWMDLIHQACYFQARILCCLFYSNYLNFTTQITYYLIVESYGCNFLKYIGWQFFILGGSLFLFLYHRVTNCHPKSLQKTKKQQWFRSIITAKMNVPDGNRTHN